MAVNVVLGGEVVEFRNFVFDQANSCFRSDVDPQAGFALSVVTPLMLDSAFEGKSFEIHFLVKKNLAESEIFQVFDKSRDQRIGWCIPVNALCSTEHDYADDIHFRKYAYVALKTCLNSLHSGLFSKRLELEEEVPVNLSQVLHECTALFVVSHETLDCAFSLPRWMPAFATVGYFPLTSLDPSDLCVERSRVERREVKLFPVSKVIQDYAHIELIYSRAYPFEKNPAFQFFYLYQMLEHLMDLVFRCEQKILVQKIVQMQNDVNATKDLLEGVGLNASEKKRMARLVSEYCCASGDLTDVVAVCCQLLIVLGIKQGNTLETTIYPVRNFLFHQFRNFPDSARQQLVSVVSSLDLFVPVLLGKFQFPTEDEVVAI